MTIKESPVCFEHTGPQGQQGVVVKGLRIINEKESLFCPICEMQNEQNNIMELTPEDFIEFLRQKGMFKDGDNEGTEQPIPN